MANISQTTTLNRYCEMLKAGVDTNVDRYGRYQCQHIIYIAPSIESAVSVGWDKIWRVNLSVLGSIVKHDIHSVIGDCVSRVTNDLDANPSDYMGFISKVSCRLDDIRNQSVIECSYSIWNMLNARRRSSETSKAVTQSTPAVTDHPVLIPQRRAMCKFCGATDVGWVFDDGRWVLTDMHGVPHRCLGRSQVAAIRLMEMRREQERIVQSSMQEIMADALLNPPNLDPKPNRSTSTPNHITVVAIKGKRKICLRDDDD